MTAQSLLPTASRSRVAATIRMLFRPYRRTAITGALIFASSIALALIPPRAVGIVVDALTETSGNSAVSTIQRIGVVAIVATLVAAVLRYIGMILMASAAERALADLRTYVFRNTIELPLDIIERAGTAEPLGRLTDDVATVTDTAHETLPQVIGDIIAVVFVCIALGLLSPLMLLSGLAAAPIMVFAGRNFLRKCPALYGAERDGATAVVGELHEVAVGSRAIHAFQAEDRRRAILKRRSFRRWAVDARLTVVRNQLFPALGITSGTALVFALGIGAFAYWNGHASLGTMSAGIVYLSRAFNPVTSMLEQVDRLQNAQIALARLVGLADANRGTDEPQPSVTSRPEEGGISLRSANFFYEPSHPVIADLDLDIRSGEKIAIVGPSGAGKSTLAKLIAGIHEPTSGTITIGGTELKGDMHWDGRPPVALVTQELHVFDGTIADNLRLAADQNTADAILWSALATVGAGLWVEQLPERLETNVGHGGSRLTVMQTQQLALARVLLADPLVVILDEATASFDDTSARTAERSLAAALEGRTVLTIAHRLDVATTADRVMVIDRGTIDIGLHDELLQRCEAYATLWTDWSSPTS